MINLKEARMETVRREADLRCPTCGRALKGNDAEAANVRVARCVELSEKLSDDFPAPLKMFALPAVE
ncbi:MAG: hypothetical protein ACXV8A_03390, partial [Chthoniobacterales bacterium]